MKTHSRYVCRHCGARAPRWQGRCATCAQWNTMEVVTLATAPATSERATSLRDVGDEANVLTSSGVDELDRVIGGGFVAGSTTLLYGEPGVGKSTLALMILRALAERGEDVLLIAAEESAAQVARRARRLGEVPEGLDVATTTNVDAAEAILRERPRRLCVVDSISAMSDDALAGGAGSLTQVRSNAERLCSLARTTGTALVLIGHVTKDGELAGPRALEHLVDTVVRIEGDRQGSLRIVRALKHRFGPTGEVGLFEMASDGLRELSDASLGARAAPLEVPGVVLTVTNDGSRSFLVEIQALVARSSGSARRVAHRVSAQRLSLLLAVLEARSGVDTLTLDIYAATAGGLEASEPGVDLALALAVASATLGFAVPRSWVALGEVGLAGELREVSGLTRRVREAARRGASTVIVPAPGELESIKGIEVVRCPTLVEALAYVHPVTG